MPSRTYDPEYLQQLRERAPLVDHVRRRVRLTNRGSEYSGLCPFHEEKTPSFIVNSKSGFYHCFGCGAHGDVIGFLMQTERLSFVDAVARLEAETNAATSKIVSFALPFSASSELNQDFIERQIAKCEERISKGDYDGAITSARSLLEAVLLELEYRLSDSVAPYDGNLSRLYKRVRKLQNWDPGDEGIAQTLKQILVGLASVVLGLGSLRNKMSDSHMPTHRAQEHHARLAVNSARTLCDFMVSSHLYQLSRRNSRLA